MILTFCYTTSFNFNCYMLLFGKHASKQKTVDSSKANCVHVLLYVTARHIYVLTLRSFLGEANISNDFNCCALKCYTCQ
jgi:hypothetical protein